MTHVYEIGKLDKEHVNYMLLLDYVQSCPKYNFDMLDEAENEDINGDQAHFLCTLSLFILIIKLGK